jgi:hypothetical protein
MLGRGKVAAAQGQTAGGRLGIEGLVHHALETDHVLDLVSARGSLSICHQSSAHFQLVTFQLC